MMLQCCSWHHQKPEKSGKVEITTGREKSAADSMGKFLSQRKRGKDTITGIDPL